MSKTACDERKLLRQPQQERQIAYHLPNTKCAPSRTKREPLKSQRRSYNLVVCRLCADGHDASSWPFSIAMSPTRQ